MFRVMTRISKGVFYLILISNSQIQADFVIVLTPDKKLESSFRAWRLNLHVNGVLSDIGQGNALYPVFRRGGRHAGSPKCSRSQSQAVTGWAAYKIAWPKRAYKFITSKLSCACSGPE